MQSPAAEDCVDVEKTFMVTDNHIGLVGVDIFQSLIDDFDPIQFQVYPAPPDAAKFNAAFWPRGESYQTSDYRPETSVGDNDQSAADGVDEIGEKTERQWLTFSLLSCNALGLQGCR